MSDLPLDVLLPQVKNWLEEDDLTRNFYYLRSLPSHPVKLKLKIKSDLLLAGTDYFCAVFKALGWEDSNEVRALERRSFKKGEEFNFSKTCPFNIAVSGERLALNLLQHGSSIATWTKKHVDLASAQGIKILDTRKTTPGLRSLEKYATRIGGAYNHRLGQTDAWMVKDNHKTSMGGLEGAYKFFQDQGALYNNIICEIHDLEELKLAIKLGVRHVMLDNFSPETLREAVKLKTKDLLIEVSGGIKLENLQEYLVPGIDAISMGSITYSAPRVDLSLKFGSV